MIAREAPWKAFPGSDERREIPAPSIPVVSFGICFILPSVCSPDEAFPTPENSDACWTLADFETWGELGCPEPRIGTMEHVQH